MTHNPGMRRWAAGALIAAGFLLSILCPVGAMATPLPDRSEVWIKIRTAHFTLFSNASEPYTIEIGLDLERFRGALARLVSGLEVNSPLPTSIYVFKHDASFQPYKMRVGLIPSNISGAFAAHRDGNYVGINATPSRSGARGADADAARPPGARRRAEALSAGARRRGPSALRV
jgi:hypothetical protein